MTYMDMHGYKNAKRGETDQYTHGDKPYKNMGRKQKIIKVPSYVLSSGNFHEREWIYLKLARADYTYFWDE